MDTLAQFLDVVWYKKVKIECQPCFRLKADPTKTHQHSTIKSKNNSAFLH